MPHIMQPTSFFLEFYEKRIAPLRRDLFIIGIILAEIVAIILLISDYGKCFQEAESIFAFTPAVIEQGRAFSLHDFANIFNVWGLDNGLNRPRFVSYFFYIVTIKTRLFLWNFFRPHPTLSIVWIFTLILSPWILYKCLKAALKERTAALAGVAIYMSTCGYLFNITMLFHPAKPLFNVIVIAMLYVLARYEQPTVDSERNPLFGPHIFRYIFPLLLTALFCDEMAIFCFLILPAWNTHYFIPRRFTVPNVKICLRNLTMYVMPTLIFLVIVVGVTPRLLGRPLEKGSISSRA